MKKVCILAPIHIWDDVRVFKKQAVSLASHGYEVSLIARMPDNIDGSTHNGVQLIKSKLSDKGKLGRIAFFYQVLKQAIDCKADIYHLHNPNTIPIAIFLSFFSKIVIYDTHEDYSQRLLFREWIPSIFRKSACKIVSSLERLTANLSSAAIATQIDVVERLGVNGHLIGNSPRYNNDLVNTVETIKINLGLQSKEFRLVYLGSINESRGIEDIIISLVRSNRESTVRFWLIGDINKDYLEKLKSLPGWQYVDYLGKLEQDIAFSYVSSSDVGLIYIHDIGDHAKTDPNKLYEYMSFGIPFIASDFSLWKDKLQYINAGVFVKPQDPLLLSKEVVKLIENKRMLKLMGERGVAYVKSNNWEKEFSKLEKIYRDVI